MRNYKRKTDYMALSEDQLAAARTMISRGVYIRQAAIEIGFRESTLRDRLKSGGGNKLGRFRATFSQEQEMELVSHCITLDKRFFGLTLKSLRFLIFKYAEGNNIPHQFSTNAQLAGRDFTRAFMKRNKLSLRIPRKTSIARTMGFNRVQLSQYFDNLEVVMKKYGFTPNQIFNMDETGVQTVPNILPKHVAPTGKREVAKAVAAEQGQTVTAVCAVNPIGYFIPPFFIYARKRENRLLIKGGPLGCDRAVTDKGYMNTPTFIKWLKHFQTKEILQEESGHDLGIDTPKHNTHPPKARLTTPGEIIPLPKITIKRKRKGKGLKSVLLTSTPNKERMENEIAEKEKQIVEKEKRYAEKQISVKEKVTKQLFFAANPKKKKIHVYEASYSSDTDAEYSIHDSRSDFMSDSEENVLEGEIENSQQNSKAMLPNDYAVVRVHALRKMLY